MPAARSAAASAGASALLDRAALRTIALAHDVCPYYLGSEMARWSDLIVGDYNYYFDMGAMLYGLTLQHQWRVSVLVDEAHNLVSRARAMYSAELHRDALREARAAAPPLVKKEMERIGRAWPGAPDDGYAVMAAPPEKLLTALQGATTAITDLLVEQGGILDAAVQRFYFDALQFVRLAELFGDHSLCDVSGADARTSTLCLRNIVPAPFLKPRFAVSHSTTLFSDLC